MRYLVLILCGTQLGMLVSLGLYLVINEIGLASGMVTLPGLVVAVCIIPATILALSGKALKVALGLSLVPPIALSVLYLMT